ncbi:MAG: Glycosyl transferase, family 2 [uncultured bacterium]|nr:MAG: Glycosyl transferase, family 2 [uncultured bacterium]OGT58541.1 MAG: hypothetical protein A3F43_04535 [Gammaproteobacteria bacterium RIFCSPHIGHO2_12_FULL_42_10]
MLPHRVNVSAILPNYNDAVLLPRAIQSLLAQSQSLTEIIIVDDASTDNSIQVIQSYLKLYPTITLIQHAANQGVSAALNTGIMRANGDYIILCAADDWYAEHMVRLASAAILRFPGVGLVCGDAIVSRFDLPAPFRRTLPYAKDAWISAREFQAIAKQSYVGFNSSGGMLLRREAVLKAGMLYPAMRWHSDWFLYFAVAIREGICYIDELFIHINMRKTSYSEGKSKRTTQNQVIRDTIHILKRAHPDLWHTFREAALLPHYDVRYFVLFLMDPVLKGYMTPKLLWKLLINNRMVVRIGRYMPYHVILQARRWLRA